MEAVKDEVEKYIHRYVHRKFREKPICSINCMESDRKEGRRKDIAPVTKRLQGTWAGRRDLEQLCPVAPGPAADELRRLGASH